MYGLYIWLYTGPLRYTIFNFISRKNRVSVMLFYLNCQAEAMQK
jgi:hypothetical protein